MNNLPYTFYTILVNYKHSGKISTYDLEKVKSITDFNLISNIKGGDDVSIIKYTITEWGRQSQEVSVESVYEEAIRSLQADIQELKRIQSPKAESA